MGSAGQVIKTLIVEDNTIVRQGVIALLSTADHIQVIGDLSDGLQAVLSRNSWSSTS